LCACEDTLTGGPWPDWKLKPKLGKVLALVMHKTKTNLELLKQKVVDKISPHFL
jgi:hypothetical protein